MKMKLQERIRSNQRAAVVKSWLTALALILGMLSGGSVAGQELAWSGMVIVDSSTPLHNEGSREAIPLPYPLVLWVDPGSEAHKQGFRAGDFIVGPPEREILSISTLMETLKANPEALRIRNKDGRKVLRFMPSPLQKESRILAEMQEQLLAAGKNPPDARKMVLLAAQVPESPIAAFLVGYTALKNGDEKAAETWFQKAAEKNTDPFIGGLAARIAPSGIRSQLQSAASKLQQESDQGKTARKAGEKDSTAPIPDPGAAEQSEIKKVSMSLAMAGAPSEETIEALREAHQKKPNDQTIREKLMFALLRKVNGNQKSPMEELEIYLHEADEMVPNNFYVNHLWGSLYLGRENFEPAAARLETAVAAQPEHLDANRKLGFAYMKMMKYEDALPPFERALKQAPKDFFLMYFVGRCQFELKEYDRAVEIWEEALPLAPSENDARQLQMLIMKAKEQQASVEGSTTDENARFVIHFAGDSQKDIGDVTMEMLEDIYDQVTSDLMYKPDIKVNVFFFRTDDFYQVNQVQKWVAAMAQGEKIMVPLRSGYSNMNAVKDTLAHEFTHVIINLRTNQNCPTWIHEGLAMMQGFKAGYGDYSSMRGDFEKLYEKRVVDEKRVKPLSQISFSARSDDSPDIKEAYLSSYLAMRYLVDRWGWQGVDELLGALGQGSHPQDALEKATNRTYKDFQKELDDWISTL